MNQTLEIALATAGGLLFVLALSLLLWMFGGCVLSAGCAPSRVVRRDRVCVADERMRAACDDLGGTFERPLCYDSIGDDAYYVLQSCRIKMMYDRGTYEPPPEIEPLRGRAPSADGGTP